MTTEQVYFISKAQFLKLKVDFVKSLDDIKSFLDEAVSNGLLTRSNEEEIMCERNNCKQNRLLHDIIHKKLPDGSRKFVSALKNSKHYGILKLLDDPLAYPMKFKPHGRVILINNAKFDDGKTYKERIGSEKDVEGIMKLFTDFNFDVQLYSNKTAKEMKSIIEKASRESTAKEDCFVMFLMSHGTLGNIIGTDGEKLSYYDINRILKSSSQLKDKPKLIYINTCESESNAKKESDVCSIHSESQIDDDTKSSRAAEIINSEKENMKKYFTIPDVFVVIATIPENQASGSVFIKSLLNVYERDRHECDIVSLSPDINAQVSKDHIPGFYSTLKKKVILRATD